MEPYTSSYIDPGIALCRGSAYKYGIRSNLQSQSRKIADERENIYE